MQYGHAALGTDSLTLPEKKKLHANARAEYLVADNKDVIVEPDFLQLTAAALEGVCASHHGKFECQSKLEIARTAVSIAKHTIQELGPCHDGN